MTVRIKRGATGKPLIRTIEEMSGVDLRQCYQCMKCSSGCQAARFTQSPPSEIIRWLHLGAREELLGSDMVWMCLSCGTCYARCPMGISIPAVMDAMRILAVRMKTVVPPGNIPLFNRLFLATVRTFGRAYEFPMLAFYKLGTRNVVSDMDKLPGMLWKGKMAVRPPSGANRRAVKRVFDRALQNGGDGK